MADILDLKSATCAQKERQAKSAEVPGDDKAKIIIFPGVRYERRVHGSHHVSGEKMLSASNAAPPPGVS